MSWKAQNILNQIPVEELKSKIQTLEKGDHFKQDLQKSYEFEIVQNSFGIKSTEGKILIQIKKESLYDQTVLLQKNLELDFHQQSELMHFRMKTTSPVLIKFSMHSVRVAMKNESEAAPGINKVLKQGKAVILFQIFQINNGKERKSKVVILQQGPIEVDFQLPIVPSFFYFSVGLTGTLTEAISNIGKKESFFWD